MSRVGKSGAAEGEYAWQGECPRIVESRGRVEVQNGVWCETSQMQFSVRTRTFVVYI